LAIAQFGGLEPPVSIQVSTKPNHKLGLSFGTRIGFLVLFMCAIGTRIFEKTNKD
jgi:hypothetical protein